MARGKLITLDRPGILIGSQENAGEVVEEDEVDDDVGMDELEKLAAAEKKLKRRTCTCQESKI
ncbi:MAG: hypothetical protein BJ554DRAFT_5488 [Olpidium bornovanus]|uniref:Uncharacterized protein n=1 Tax=Olpidium bornovanus TaxID=278681 RepID=A0A8H8A069_9FUNG|nr:MAG: hypothetical protein BJ554DRAFT_5488 [Olpidium bornovanus]